MRRLQLFVITQSSDSNPGSGEVDQFQFADEAVFGHLDRLLLPRRDAWWSRWKSYFEPLEEWVGPIDKSGPLGHSAFILGHLYPIRSRSFLFSGLFLAFTLLSVVAVETWSFSQARMVYPETRIFASAPLYLIAPRLSANREWRGDSGGGARAPLPASRGRLPKVASQQIVPPQVDAPTKAELVIEPALIAPPDVQVVQLKLPVWGDPLAELGLSSNGPGSDGGMGAGIGGGIAGGLGNGKPSARKEGKGAGFGIVAGGGVIPPRAIKTPPPVYTSEAYQAKLEGKVVLQVLISLDGTARVLRVVSGLPMGLTEKAIEAVQKWTFEVGRRNGQAIALEAQVTIFFRL